MSVGNVTALHYEVAKHKRMQKNKIAKQVPHAPLFEINGANITHQPVDLDRKNFGKSPEIRFFAKFSTFGHDV